MDTFKPEIIKILFIAEAPGAAAPGVATPGALNKHFYSANTNLYRTVLAAFEQVYGSFDSAQEFFTFFKSMGCYLDHLSLAPIDKNDPSSRKIARQNAVYSLSERLKSHQPQILVILMKDIHKQVMQAVEGSGIDSVQFTKLVPYPAGSDTNKKNCIAEIVSLLRSTEINQN